MPTLGKLKIKVCEGKLVSPDRWEKIDPFVKIIFQGKEWKTSIKDDADITPVWNETHELTITNMSDDIVFKCYDDDFMKTQKVGNGKVKVFEWCKEPTSEGWWPLETHGKNGGKLRFELTWQAAEPPKKKHVEYKPVEKKPVEKVVEKVEEIVEKAEEHT